MNGRVSGVPGDRKRRRSDDLGAYRATSSLSLLPLVWVDVERLLTALCVALQPREALLKYANTEGDPQWTKGACVVCSVDARGSGADLTWIAIC